MRGSLEGVLWGMRCPALPLLVILLVAPLLGGCRFQTTREVDEQAKRDQMAADLHAAIFEAATAASKGVDLQRTTTGIRIAAATLLQVMGFHYAPAEAWLKTIQLAPTSTPTVAP